MHVRVVLARGACCFGRAAFEKTPSRGSLRRDLFHRHAFVIHQVFWVHLLLFVHHELEAVAGATHAMADDGVRGAGVRLVPLFRHFLR